MMENKKLKIFASSLKESKIVTLAYSVFLDPQLLYK